MKLAQECNIRAGGAFTPRSIGGGGGGALKLWLRSDLGVTINEETLVAPDAFDNAAWSVGGGSVTPNVTTDPFGGSGADSLIEDTSLGNHFVHQTLGNRVAGLTETWSVYAKAGTRNFVALGDDTGGHWSWFNLTTGALGTQAGLSSRSIFDAGNGWWQLTVTSTGFDGAFCVFLGSADNTASYTGNGTGNAFLFRAAATQPKVSAWADQSGNGNHLTQGTAANQPLYVANGAAPNGRACLRFDGVNDDLFRSNTNLWGAGAYAFGIAFKGLPTNTYLLSDAVAGAGVGFGSTAATRTFTHQNVENHTDAAAVGTAETWIGSRAAASAPTLLVNGGAQSLTNTSNTVLDPGGAAILAVGSFGHIGNFPASDIYEVIGYNRDLTTEEKTLLANYLRRQWGTP